MGRRNKRCSSKNKISNNLLLIFFLTLLVLMMNGSVNKVQGTITLFDDFEDGNLDDWELYGYNDASGINVATAHDITIVDGAMKAPDSVASVVRSQALKNSTASFGTWSLDLVIDTAITSEASTSFNFAFMFTDLRGIYDLTGLNSSEFQWTGYALAFVSVGGTGNYAGTTPDFARPGISLIKYYNNTTTYFTILESHNMQREEVTGNHHVDITRDESGQIIVYFDKVQLFSITDNTINSSEKISFTSWLGGPIIDNIQVKGVVEEIIAPASTISTPLTSTIIDQSTTQTETENNEYLFIPIQRQITIGVVATLLISSLLGYYFVYLPKIKKPLLQFPKRVSDEISSVFHNRPSLLYLILSQKGKHPTPAEEDLVKSIPKEIFDYKFLMHPVRLAITKLLFETIELTSIEIKNSLDLNWGDYSSHIKALLKQDYVYTREEFRDGSVKQVITLTDLGHRSYDQLKTILFDFLTNSPESYLNYVDKHYSDQIRFTETEE